MTWLDTDDSSAHKFSENIVPFRLGASARRQDAQSSAVSHAAGVSSRG